MGGRDVNSMENVLMTRSPRHNQRIRMADSLRAVLLFFIFVNPAFAQTDVLIEVDRARSEGLFTPTPVYQRAILSKPAQPTTIALLYFRGNPGIAQIQSVADTGNPDDVQRAKLRVSALQWRAAKLAPKKAHFELGIVGGVFDKRIRAEIFDQ